MTAKEDVWWSDFKDADLAIGDNDIPDTNVGLTGETRPSAKDGLEVGSVKLQLGPHARALFEVRAPTKALAMSRASELADKWTSAARGDTAAAQIVRSLVPPQVKGGLKLLGSIAKAAGAGRLRSLWRHLPHAVRAKTERLARELTT